MKTYIKPEIVEVKVMADMHLLAGSGGVETGGSPTDTFKEEDISYSRGGRGFWDDEEDY